LVVMATLTMRQSSEKAGPPASRKDDKFIWW
jgi:hypothetical protein